MSGVDGLGSGCCAMSNWKIGGGCNSMEERLWNGDEGKWCGGLFEVLM